MLKIPGRSWRNSLVIWLLAKLYKGNFSFVDHGDGIIIRSIKPFAPAAEIEKAIEMPVTIADVKPPARAAAKIGIVQASYHIYAEFLNYNDYNGGNVIPDFDDLPDKIQAAWTAAVVKVMEDFYRQIKTESCEHKEIENALLQQGQIAYGVYMSDNVAGISPKILWDALPEDSKKLWVDIAKSLLHYEKNR